MKVDVADGVNHSSRVTKGDIFKIDLATRSNELHRIRRVAHGRHGIENGKNLRGCAERALHDDVELAQGFDWLVEDKNS